MTSRLVEMQARFQQKQIQDREEKLLRLYENQQQRAFERMGRGSAGSNTSNASLGATGGGKVRQMFDERRQKAGIDRSYPLEPLKNGGSADKLKNSTRRTVVKSTVQKSVSHVRNAKPLINKREVVHSIYNNNDGDETYEEYRFRDDENNFSNVSHGDIVDLMNNHNLDDSIENEEMPQIGFETPNELNFTGKLSNVGGKLPSENTVKTESKSKIGANALGKTFRKETKPIVRRTVKPAPSPQNLTSAHSQPLKTVTSPISSPARSTSYTMQSQKSTPIKKGATATPQSAKTPNNCRPSSKQTAKSPVARDDLNECKYCSRRFASDRLQVHESICGKTAKKKRKTYDATKHRVEGTELAQYVRKGGMKGSGSKSSKPAPVSKKDWRRTHEDFINTIRAAKTAQAYVAKGGKLSDLPPPPPSSNPDYVQCPHCGRKFNGGAAERHIPKCANYIFNKPTKGAKVAGKSR